MVVKEAIEIKRKITMGEQYNSTGFYVGNPGDVLATLENGEQCFIPKALYQQLVIDSNAPTVYEIAK